MAAGAPGYYEVKRCAKVSAQQVKETRWLSSVKSPGQGTLFVVSSAIARMSPMLLVILMCRPDLLAKPASPQLVTSAALPPEIFLVGDLPSSDDVSRS